MSKEKTTIKNALELNTLWNDIDSRQKVHLRNAFQKLAEINISKGLDSLTKVEFGSLLTNDFRGFGLVSQELEVLRDFFDGAEFETYEYYVFAYKVHAENPKINSKIVAKKLKEESYIARLRILEARNIEDKARLEKQKSENEAHARRICDLLIADYDSNNLLIPESLDKYLYPKEAENAIPESQRYIVRDRIFKLLKQSQKGREVIAQFIQPNNNSEFEGLNPIEIFKRKNGSSTGLDFDMSQLEGLIELLDNNTDKLDKKGIVAFNLSKSKIQKVKDILRDKSINQ
jgi:hypothetical protein